MVVMSSVPPFPNLYKSHESFILVHCCTPLLAISQSHNLPVQRRSCPLLFLTLSPCLSRTHRMSALVASPERSGSCPLSRATHQVSSCSNPAPFGPYLRPLPPLSRKNRNSFAEGAYISFRCRLMRPLRPWGSCRAVCSCVYRT